VLTSDERAYLLRAARGAIRAELEGEKPEPQPRPPQSLLELQGAFVTLHKRNMLRGCIGFIEGVKPLLDTVREVAVKAAFEDPRFPPLQLTELGDVHLEISVLSPLELVRDVSTIEVGTHGLVLELAGRRGLLLPQVAVEYGWDRETFLNNTAQKAGFPPDAWRRPDARIYKFSADVFGEKRKE